MEMQRVIAWSKNEASSNTFILQEQLNGSENVLNRDSMIKKELNVSDEFVALDKEYVKPIFEKGGEYVHEFLIASQVNYQGIVMNRAELNFYLRGLGYDEKNLINQLDNIRDCETIRFLRRDEDFSEDMDRLNIDKDNCMPILPLYYDKNRLDSLNVDLMKLYEIGNHVKHETLDTTVILIDKQELEKNLEQESKEIFVGHDEVYLIEGFELDVEMDYFSGYVSEKSIMELEYYIEDNEIKPIQSNNGYIVVPNNEDVIVYSPKTGDVDYANAYEERNAREMRLSNRANYFEVER